jgi:type IV secretion system protein TrbL
MSVLSTVCVVAGPICSVGQGAANAATGAVSGGILSSIASDFSSAEGEMLKLLLSAWVNVPSPSLSSTSGTVGFLQSSLSWYVAAAAVLGLLVAAGRLAIERKPDAAKEAATGMLTTLLTIGAGVATISLLSAAGDAFSTWILDQAAGSATPTQALTQLGSFAGLVATAGPGLIILLSVLAIIGMVVQLAMVLIRSVLLVVLVGVWPLAAASSMTEMGRQWYKKITGWMIAFLLFKPAAAIVYAAAIKMTLTADSELSSIEGIILIILASLTLPALMKFIVPAVSSVGSMGAGEVLGAGIAAATGAAMVIGTAGVGAAAAGAGAMAGSAAGGSAGGAAGGGAGGAAGGGAGGAVSGEGVSPGGDSSGGASPGSGSSGSSSAGGVSAGDGGAPEGAPSGAGSAPASPSSSPGSSGSGASRGVGLSHLVGTMRGSGGASQVIEGEPAAGAAPS